MPAEVDLTAMPGYFIASLLANLQVNVKFLKYSILLKNNYSRLINRQENPLKASIKDTVQEYEIIDTNKMIEDKTGLLEVFD